MKIISFRHTKNVSWQYLGKGNLNVWAYSIRMLWTGSKLK